MFICTTSGLDLVKRVGRELDVDRVKIEIHVLTFDGLLSGVRV